MCGIVGYIGYREVTPVLLEGLKRLEYRGYDSAGIAVVNDHHVSIRRAEGKLSQLVARIGQQTPPGHAGIGHTRWATHGKPSEKNAHPHQAGRVVLVHNGIVENYHSLKEELTAAGVRLKSETDTEIICHVINRHLKKNVPFFPAFQKALSELEGTYALAVLDLEEPDKVYAAKKGSPLVVGLGENENFVASDIPAVLPYTKKVVFLEDDEMAVLTGRSVSVLGKNGKEIKKSAKEIQWSAEMAEKGGYKHFMLKEIFEQPRAVGDTLIGRVLKGSEKINLGVIDPVLGKGKFPFFNRFYLVACGTSWHAAMAGKYFIEAIAKIPVSVDTASEFRYREPFIDRKTLLLVISQSGETADTLACAQEARRKGAKVISICNAIDSGIPRAAHATLYTNAGPEIGVASTKAFTTQLTLLLMLSLYLGKKNGWLKPSYIKRAVNQLIRLPYLMEKVLGHSDGIAAIAGKFYRHRDFYFIARGVHHPIALEGALKLKEISYIHAEGYSAGEMKHGPIALIEPGAPVVALAPQDRVCEKMISNIEEVQARGARVIAIATEGDLRFEKKCDSVFYVPKSEWYLTPILASLPLQLLAYYVADLKGTDVDQPRNLAKSVTVE
ncbi:MAG: glutamine--fructose-6-phosphate transaminase (isomerizing) [Deltaproteobacteria bacterium]|nr:glutamine--fructose-6-phosphate transaminase (isomerizing) [Deltaproteobacteria bacterium]